MEQGLIVCASSFEAVGNLPPCDICQLYALINRIFTIGIGLLGVVAVLMIIITGFLYMTSQGDEGRLTKAKQGFRFAIIGFVIVVLSFVIIKTALAILGYPPGGGNPFTTFTCETGGVNPTGGLPATGTAPDVSPPQPAQPPGAGSQSSSEVEQQLRDAGITISPGAGTEGMKRSTVAGLVNFKEDSGCPINLNGGTESGHASGAYSHANGYKVDIPRSACSTSYIEKNYDYIGNRGGDGARLYKDDAGNVYADEGDHWDIAYCYGACTGGLRR